MDPRQHPGYDALRDEWYAKLKAEGFVDVEHGTDLFIRDHHIETRVRMTACQLSGGDVWAKVWQAWLTTRTWPTRVARLAAACMSAGVLPSEIPALFPQRISGWPRVATEWRTECRAWWKEQHK